MQESDIILPIDSLWSKETLLVPLSVGDTDIGLSVQTGEGYLFAGIVVILSIMLILYFRDIRNIVPLLFKSLFRYGWLLKIEEKNSLAIQRNRVALVSSVCFPLFVIFSVGEFLSETTATPANLITIYLVSAILIYWIFKGLLLQSIGWATGERGPFLFIGKIGRNYFSLLFFVAIPFFLFFILSGYAPIVLIKILITISMVVYLIYLLRVSQIIILSRFSHFFYILYLCAVELLPLGLIIKFLFRL